MLRKLNSINIQVCGLCKGRFIQNEMEEVLKTKVFNGFNGERAYLCKNCCSDCDKKLLTLDKQVGYSKIGV